MDLDTLSDFFILTSTTDVECINRQWLWGFDFCTSSVPLYSLHSATPHWVVEHAVTLYTYVLLTEKLAASIPVVLFLCSSIWSEHAATEIILPRLFRNIHLIVSFPFPHLTWKQVVCSAHVCDIIVSLSTLFHSAIHHWGKEGAGSTETHRLLELVCANGALQRLYLSPYVRWVAILL